MVLPTPTVVRDEEADGALSQGHDERDELVRTRREGKSAGRPEGSSAVPQEQAARLEKREATGGISYDFRIGRLELRGPNILAFERQVQPRRLRIDAGYRLEIDEVPAVGNDNPVAPTRADETADRERPC